MDLFVTASSLVTYSVCDCLRGSHGEGDAPLDGDLISRDDDLPHARLHSREWNAAGGTISGWAVANDPKDLTM